MNDAFCLECADIKTCKNTMNANCRHRKWYANNKKQYHIIDNGDIMDNREDVCTVSELAVNIPSQIKKVCGINSEVL